MTSPGVSDTGLVLQTILSRQESIATDVSVLRENVGRSLTHLEVIDARNRIADELHRDFEARLRLLERFRWTIAGLFIVGNIVSVLIGYWIGHVFT